MRSFSHTGSVLTALAVLGILLIPVGPVSATLVSLSASPDLSLIAAGPAIVNRTSLFTQTYTVTNIGGADAHNVVLALVPSEGLSFVSSASDPSCVLASGRINCSASVIGADQAKTYPLSFSTTFQDACSTVAYSVSAVVSANEPELSSSNNSANLSTTIACVEASTQCNDGIDNDKDGKIDMLDLGCILPSDNSEARDQILAEQDRSAERQRMRVLSHMGLLSSSSSSSVSSSSSSLASSSSSCSGYSCGTQAVKVFLNVSRQEVLPGDTVSIVGHVQNRTNDTLRNVEVVFYYDNKQFSSVTGDGAVSAPGRLTWTINLRPNEVRELRMGATVASTATPGSTISATLRALGVNGYPNAVLQMPVVGTLPQTGAGFLAALEDTHRFLRPIEGGSALMLFGILTGLKFLVAGGIVGRKFLARR